MATNATVFKAQLQISDIDRGYYHTHDITLARHPSETDIRMMVRIISFIIFADEMLTFTKGISEESQPDLWRHNLSGECEQWIELGSPDEKRLRKACGKSKQVVIVNYSGASSDIWWQQNETKLARYNHLSVVRISPDEVEKLVEWAKRSMQIQATIQDGCLWLTCDNASLQITPIWLKPSS